MNTDHGPLEQQRFKGLFLFEKILEKLFKIAAHFGMFVSGDK